jgi:hypothetical protein
VNIFGARELLGSGEIRIKDKNLVVNQKGKGLFRFDKHIMIIEEPKQYAFPVVTQKKPTETLICLWHRRLVHLGLDNVRKTTKIVKGIIIKEEELKEDDQLQLCDPCKRSKPL